MEYWEYYQDRYLRPERKSAEAPQKKTESKAGEGLTEIQMEQRKAFVYEEGFNIDRWYNQLKDYTYRSLFLPVSTEQAHAILNPKAEGSDKHLRAFAAMVDDALDKLGDGKKKGAFVRLGSRSPKDAAFNSPAMPTHLKEILAKESASRAEGKGAKQNAEFLALFAARVLSSVVRSGQDALALLTESKRVHEDLTRSFQHKEAEWTVCLAVREWVDIPVWAEFRGFVFGKRLMALTQYLFAVHFEDEICKRKEDIRWACDMYLEHSGLKEALPYDNCIIDFVVPLESKRSDPESWRLVRLVELNPWHRQTSPCLYNWKMDLPILEGRDLAPGALPALKVVEEPLPVLREERAITADPLLEGVDPEILAENAGLLSEVSEFLQDDCERISSQLSYVLPKVYGNKCGQLLQQQ